MTDALLDDELRVFAYGSVGVTNSRVADTTLIRAGSDAYVFDSSSSGYTAIRLGNSDDELVIGGSSFDELHADGGRGDNAFEDGGDNDFGELDLQRLGD